MCPTPVRFNLNISQASYGRLRMNLFIWLEIRERDSLNNINFCMHTHGQLLWCRPLIESLFTFMVDVTLGWLLYMFF